MKPFEVMSQGEFHQRMPQGNESDWIEFANLEIANGKIAVSDPTFYRDLPPPPTFDLASGSYAVAVKVIRYPDFQSVSRLRVVGETMEEFGTRIGEVGVDSGQVGVFDPVLLNEVSESMSEDYARRILKERRAIDLYGVAHFDEDKAIMPIASSGHGDGGYPIHELTQADRRVGIEVVFIGPEVFAD